MEQRRKCIFHVPNYIEPTAKSGSTVRPFKMLQAFKDIGYDVDVVMGYGKERKQQIKLIKNNILNGVVYDFMYSESSTMPTLLTEKSHLPLYPFLDFGLFSFCKKHGIKIGLFYRDIQWKFPFYKENVSLFKRMISIPMYYYDLYIYNKLLDVLYLATDRVFDYLSKYPKLLDRADVLMPGCEGLTEESIQNFNIGKNTVNVFYVGGISGIYDIRVFLKAVSLVQSINAIVCCREPEWNQVRDEYEQYIGSNIKIVHASGKELLPYYKWADICSAFGGDGEYFSIAMPVKVFEYLSHNKPILGVKNSVSGDLIEKETLGWSAEYSVEALKACLENIVQNPNEINYIKEKQCVFIKNNTWQMRAKKVARDLEV